MEISSKKGNFVLRTCASFAESNGLSSINDITKLVEFTRGDVRHGTLRVIVADVHDEVHAVVHTFHALQNRHDISLDVGGHRSRNARASNGRKVAVDGVRQVHITFKSQAESAFQVTIYGKFEATYDFVGASQTIGKLTYRDSTSLVAKSGLT